MLASKGLAAYLRISAVRWCNFFAFNAAGYGTAAENFSTGRSTVQLPQATAKPGQSIVAFSAGLGPIATVDTQPAGGEVLVPGVYSGRAPGLVGEDQNNFTIAAGSFVVRPCSDVANPLSQQFMAGKNLGTLQLLHTDTLRHTQPTRWRFSTPPPMLPCRGSRWGLVRLRSAFAPDDSFALVTNFEGSSFTVIKFDQQRHQHGSLAKLA